MKKINEINAELNNWNPRSAWDKGVKEYALELMEEYGWSYDDEDQPRNSMRLEDRLLNGARNWLQYSEGGCSLIYNGDIAKRLCTASELKKTQDGLKDPNPRENWIQCQARALSQAAWRIERIAFDRI